MKHVFVGVSLAGFAYAAVAVAAGPYDGNWAGNGNVILDSTMTPGYATSCQFSVTVTVTDNTVTGTMKFPRVTAPLSGTIAPDGSFKSSTGAANGKFAGNSFEGTWLQPTGLCRNYRMTMTRS